MGNGHLASLALLCRGKALEVSQRVPVGLREHVSEVGSGALFLDNLAQRLQESEKICKNILLRPCVHFCIFFFFGVH